MEKMKLKVLKSRRYLIGWIISLLFLFLFFFSFGGDFSEIGRALAEANYIFVLPAVILLVIIMGLKAVRWQYLLRYLKHTPLGSVFSVTVIGHMVDSLLPRPIGDMSRAYLLGGKEQISKMSTFATVAVARIFDGLSLLFFMVIVWQFVPLPPWLVNGVYIVAGLFLGALVLFLVLALSPGRLQKAVALFLRLLPKRWGSKLEEWLELFISGLAVLKSPSKLCFIFLLSLLIWFVEAVMFYTVGASFNLGQPFYVFILAAAITNFALFLPSMFGGLGNWEYACREALSIFGVNIALASAYAIVLHAVVLIPIILLGFIFLWTQHISLAKIVSKRDIK
ncbi:MAG: flippase-like domain-containing protein [Desulfobacteraceae bacterium]|nr:flippase-like domain-containing protein [Desulfobacteraceae bacterium]